MSSPSVVDEEGEGEGEGDGEEVMGMGMKEGEQRTRGSMAYVQQTISYERTDNRDECGGNTEENDSLSLQRVSE